MTSLPGPLVRLPELVVPESPAERPKGAGSDDEGSTLAGLQAALGRSFERPALLRVAMTAGSWVNENREAGWPSNACLEFFGDAVLDLLAADALWRAFPGLDEGPLTRLRASLVSEPSLAEAARGLGLGRWLHVGRGDDQRGARDRDRTLADALEASLGAVYLDAREAGEDPMRAAAEVFERLFGERLRGLEAEDGLDPKSRLQQRVQGERRLTPSYRALAAPEAGESLAWRACVEIADATGEVAVLGEGTGRSLREAERAAAIDALRRLDATIGR